MTTSSSWDFGLTSATLSAVVAENLGILAAGGTLASNDLTTIQRRLNMVAKQLGRSDGAPGIKVHHRQRVTLVLAKGQQTYSIGPASGDARASLSVYRTTLSADEAALQTTLSITSNTDTTTYPGTTGTMTASDIVGIELNDGTVHWSTISGTPASTMDVASGIASVASAGNYVWWFTSRAQRLAHIESITLRNENYNETPLTIYTDAREYSEGVVDKYADGMPTAVLVEPLRIATRLTFNSQPNDVTQQVIITGFYPAEDYDNASGTDDIAFPQEAFRFLAWEVTFDLHAAYGVTWTPAMDRARNEARSMYFNLYPENSVEYFRGTGV